MNEDKMNKFRKSGVPYNITTAKRCEAMLLSRQLKNEEVCTDYDEAPCFKGTTAERDEYINSRLKGINYKGGRILVRMIVRGDGTVTDVHCVSGADYTRKQKIEDIFYTIPKWQPARKDGKAVSAYYDIPITNGFSDKEQYYSDDHQMLNYVFNSCVATLSGTGVNMNENICRQCLTEEFRASLKKPFAENLLATDRIDGWAEKKYDMVKLPENWYIINYASSMFTENGKYRQTVIHLKTTENDTKIDGISTTPAEDKTLVKYIRSMCVDINSLENVYKPHFKTTGDGSSIIALCSVKEVGNKTASVSFISTWDGRFEDIKVDDEYRKSYNPK